MKRQYFIPATALLGLGLFCGCASTNNRSCAEPRQGLFSRWFGNRNHGDCDCVETGRVTVGEEGPILPDPGYGTFGVPVTTRTIYPTMPPPTALPNPNPLAPPTEAGPASRTKDVGKAP